MSEGGLSMVLEGAEKLIAQMQGAVVEANVGLAAALYREGQAILGDALPITPIDTGALRASGHVTLPVIAGQVVEVQVGFGGSAAPYALIVHENLDAYHEPPTQAKFLETTVNAHAPEFAAALGRELKLLGG